MFSGYHIRNLIYLPEMEFLVSFNLIPFSSISFIFIFMGLALGPAHLGYSLHYFPFALMKINFILKKYLS